MAEPPYSGFTLIPLYMGGLWEAVIMIPQARFWLATAQDKAGVGMGAAVTLTGISFAMSARARCAANFSDINLVS